MNFIILILNILLQPLFILCNLEQWKVVLETGRRPFSGSSADIFLQLIGDLRASELVLMQTSMRRETGSTQQYVFTFNNDIGQLRQLIIGLQRNQLFYSDWFLYRVELIDTLNKSYVFTCNCWLSRTNPRQLLNLGPQKFPDFETMHYHGSRYPVTLGLLSMLTFFIMFTYAINFLRKKWRNRMRLDQMRMHFRRTQVPTNEGISTYTNNRHETVTMEINRNEKDVPPMYKDLFPDVNEQQQHQQQQLSSSANK